MKRAALTLEPISDWHNLAAAFVRARSAAKDNATVRGFQGDLEHHLSTLRTDLLSGEWQPGPMSQFRIRDPKPRLIHAPAFADRVVHHALMAQAGPVLDRTLIDDTYACREGKGPVAAVQRAQHFVRRWPWYVQIDIAAYFASIDHAVLRSLLARKFRNPGVLALFDRIVCAHGAEQGRGLPIGALTSQHLANVYLAGLDRFLEADQRVRGQVRYMDDVLWFCDSRETAHATLQAAGAYLLDALCLQIKPSWRLGQARHGLVYCGYRIQPGALLLSRRRKQRYAQCRARWEQAFAKGEIDAAMLQRRYASAQGMTGHADATHWRREQLQRHPLVGELAEDYL